MRCTDNICESTSGCSWCKRAGGPQVGKCVSCMWSEAILTGGNSSQPGEGVLRQGEDVVGGDERVLGA